MGWAPPVARRGPDEDEPLHALRVLQGVEAREVPAEGVAQQVEPLDPALAAPLLEGVGEPGGRGGVVGWGEAGPAGEARAEPVDGEDGEARGGEGRDGAEEEGRAGAWGVGGGAGGRAGPGERVNFTSSAL